MESKYTQSLLNHLNAINNCDLEKIKQQIELFELGDTVFDSIVKFIDNIKIFENENFRKEIWELISENMKRRYGHAISQFVGCVNGISSLSTKQADFNRRTSNIITTLEKALEDRRQQAKYDLARHIKETILEHGYDVAEIASLLTARRRRSAGGAKGATRRGTRQYTKYVDPQNPDNVYVRGVIPSWMKERMQEQGYDASSKPDREAFKANYLHVLDE